ncbi:MAG: hypothetical protein K2J20_03260, partial [Bacilli bacterium]|nr:hypothetical protein [Bacilli bacterium]
KEMIASYNVMLGIDIPNYIKTNPRLQDKVMGKNYKTVNYVISLENQFYRDILGLRQNKSISKTYNLEEIVSVGKYKINLFNEQILKFLNFLEMHLAPIYTDQVINELIIYRGLEIDDLRVLRSIADNIEPLYQALEKIVDSIPSWINGDK